MKTELLKNRLVVIIEDDVVLNSVSLYDAVVDTLSGAPIKRIAIDLSRLEHLDDLNITMLMRIIDRFSPRGYTFSFLNPGKAVLKFLVFKDISSRVPIEYDKSLKKP